MKFAHIADTHLGEENFKLKKRKFDFRRAFKKAVGIFIEEDVDFVVHGGDFFDDPEPSHDEIIFAIDQLRRLKKRSIPFLVIPGSHDIGVGGTVLSLLEEVGMVTNLASKRYNKKRNGEIVKKGEKVDGAYIVGLEGRRARARQLYRNINVDKKEGLYNIFLFHHSVSSVDARFADISSASLPPGFDYYAGGHYHFGPKLVREKGRKIVYPGSTEYCDTREMLEGKKKGFFIVEDDEARFIDLEPRPVEVVKRDCSGLSPKEVTKKCVEALENPKGNRKPLIVTELRGRLGEGSKTEIDRSLIKKKAKKRGYLYNRILMSGLENPRKEKYRKVKERSIEEIEKGVLKRKGYSSDEIELAKSLVKFLPEGREDLAMEITKRHFGLIKEKDLEDFK